MGNAMRAGSRDIFPGRRPKKYPGLKSQLEILIKRARLLRSAISFATLSALVAAILVIALFFTAFLHVEAVLLNAILFILCLVSLILSLVTFLQDINMSLSALSLELGLKEDHTG